MKLGRWGSRYASPVLGGLLMAGAIAVPIPAHEIKTSADVAATFHIEPSHNPKAGQASKAWFALTRRGGKLIPLSQCDCKLAVYALPRNSGATPVSRPPLTAYNVERFQGIPSAAVTFPKPGLYQLELSGKPKGDAQFSPFSLSYRVTVGR
jgi:hypothetical protein